MNYLICSTGRARSGTLANYLRKLGCGKPDEFYERVRFDLYKIQKPAEVQAYLEEYRVNGIFGMKMVWSHVRTMHETLGLQLKEFIDTYIPDSKYIYMKRDPFKQAIESVMYGIRKAGKPFKTDNFCMDTARARVVRIIIGYQAWELFFEKNNIDPIRVKAEDLEKDPTPVCATILKDLGVQIELKPLKNTFADSLMNEFRDKMYKQFLRRYQLLMSDIQIEDFL